MSSRLNAAVGATSGVELPLHEGVANEYAEAASTPCAQVLGHRIARLGLGETVEQCRGAVLRNGRVHHVSLNAAKIVRARDDERLAAIVRNAQLVSADGQSVVWASRLLGDPLPERVAGIDLMLRLLEVAEDEGFRVFILGAQPEVLGRALANLRARFPNEVLAGSHHGYFDDGESARICQTINSVRPHILFIAMSTPRKEYWVGDNGHLLDVPLIVGVGGAIDIVAGTVARAPVWMQRAGLEWAFRLLQEPKRLWRRYLVTNVRFVGLVARAVVGRTARQIRRRLRLNDTSASGSQ